MNGGNIIDLEDIRAAKLRKRAAGWGFELVREDGGTWSLLAHGHRKPELAGATLAEVAGNLDEIEEQANRPNEDLVLS